MGFSGLTIDPAIVSQCQGFTVAIGNLTNYFTSFQLEQNGTMIL
jgi:hypothetical protein